MNAQTHQAHAAERGTCIYLSVIFAFSTLRHPAPSIARKYSQSWRKMAFHSLFLNTACNCRHVQLELKENGFSQFIPQYSMQLQTHMQCRTWHLSFLCSAWQKAAGPQKRFRIWIPTHFEDWCPGQDLDHCHFLYLQIQVHQTSLPATEFWGHLKPIRCLWLTLMTLKMCFEC